MRFPLFFVLDRLEKDQWVFHMIKFVVIFKSLNYNVITLGLQERYQILKKLRLDCFHVRIFLKKIFCANRLTNMKGILFQKVVDNL